MIETKPKDCKFGETWCEAMTENLDQMANAHKRGLTTIVLSNLTTGTTRLAGIAYRKSAKDRGLMLNYCPWCGEPIEEDAIAHKATINAEGSSDAPDGSEAPSSPAEVGQAKGLVA